MARAHPRRGVRRTGLGLVTAAVLAVTGCAASVQGAGGGAQDQAADELRVAITSYPSSWDQDFVAFDLPALTLFKNIYPYLVDYGVTAVDGGQTLDTANIFPTWAESFTSDDGQTWTLRLREGAAFPNGNPLTASDVKWSKDRALAANANVAGVYRLIGLTSPDQIRVVDDRTVVFEQDWPSALTEQVQAISLFVHDAETMQQHATPDDPWAQEWAAQNPTDGGYYVVAEATPGQEIVLRANPAYPADNAAEIETIRFTVVPDTASAALLLREGDVDVAMGLSAAEIADLEGAPGVEVLSTPSNEQVSLPMNTTAAPFDDVLVRRAVASALPYEQIIATVYGGEARRPHSLVPIDMPGYTEAGFPYEQDIAEATRLMAESGAGAVTVDLAYPAEDRASEQIAILVKDALAPIGITATPLPLDPATIGERRAAGDLDMQVATGQQWVNDVEYLVNTTFASNGYLNYANYSSPEVDAAVEGARTITDESAREAIWAQVQAALARDVPAIPLAQPNFALPVRDDVGGFVQPVDGLIRFNTFTRG
ncbi:ABC transporter substrate-binding protein [Pseudonocardia sp. MH-G8]|uniref:ABC transporter substrate-binding protein n=1 Tax=Pseudonocardia sp. MH-G8 TaxID=1854588 RepID=UPI0013046BB8|nr:ABC transporter substrate-binding protein [Pseudonocardia sp. MH-G8]